MWISELRAIGLAGFADTGAIELGSALNILVGQNNAGKSALLSSLGHQMSGSPHRDEARFRAVELPAPEIHVQVHVTRAEIRETIFASQQPLFFPTKEISETASDQIMKWLDRDQHHLKLRRQPGQTFHLLELDGLPEAGPRSFVVTPRGGSLDIEVSGQLGGERIEGVLTALWSRFTFHFGPQRYSLGRVPMGRHDRLTPDASNLPAVLIAMQGDRGTDFNAMKAQVSEIFENVGNISITVTNNNHFEVRTWPTHRMDDPELSFSLDNSGTGVAQVIAVIVAAITTPPGLVCIDEISSFLHPAAAKALLRTLQTRYPYHQYIISTHSPEVLSSGSADTVKLVRRSGYCSTVQDIKIEDIAQLRVVFGNLGASMSDVFGADRIIWVEGETEEAVFPFIYSVVRGIVPKGTLVTPVLSTGDFNARRKRDRELAFQLYEQLATAAAPLVKASIFSFDREALTEQDQEALRGESRDRVRFLPRRNFESFLLEPQAIAVLINSQLDNAEVQAQQVADWIEAHGGDREYGAEAAWKDGGVESSLWLRKVDGARFLIDAVTAVSHARANFSKVRDGIHIVRWLLENDRTQLEPLIDYVVGLYEEVERTESERQVIAQSLKN